MSGQDINPFASPEDVNPFADSTPTHGNQKPDFADEFNPFAVQQTQPQPVTPTPQPVVTPPQPKPAVSPPAPSKQTSPATLEPSWATPVPTRRQDSTGFKGYGTVDDSMQQRQEELDRKAEELDRKEAELRKRASHGDGINNFPPLPKFCCVGPCYYHDIGMEIPIEQQRTCRMVFFAWQLYVITLLINVLSALAGVCEEFPDAPMLFGIALLYFLLFPIMSFICWYRPLYKALKGNSSFNFMLFFFVFGCQIVLMFIYALGINSMGTCGWINSAKAAGLNHGVSVMYFLTAGLFTLLTIIYVYLLRRVHNIFRSTGASVQKAQKEFAQGMASNKAVQQAAVDGDPSVTAQTQSSKGGAQEYNPFDQQTAPKPSPYNNPPPSYSPATIEPQVAPTYEAKPFGGQSAVSQDDTMRQRQEELERKAAELDKKEQELKRVQTNLPKENNFPPFPKFFPCNPCFYHDISAEIPIQSQRTCKMVFYLWQLYIVTLVFNFICALALLCDGGSGGATTFGVSLLYLILFPPISFLFWYRPLYKALRNDSSFNYFLFFFIFFFQIIFCVLYAIGISGFGTTGWINGAQHADEAGASAAVTGMMFVCAALFTLLCILQIFLLRKIHGFYRSSGASLQKAQTEFATGVASNKNVQQAAAEAVKAGINSNTQQGNY